MSGIEQATKDLTRRLSQAAAGTGPAADALDRLGLSANELIALPLDQRVGAINAAIESFVPAAERAAVAGQLFGEEGSIAMSRIDTATLRQATEDVLAFGVVVSEQDADQIERTNDAISRLGLIWRGLSNQLAVAAAPALEAVANAMAAIASRTGPLGIAIRGLFDNIGRLTTYAATFAAFLAGRWVAGLAAAALSVRGLATALVLLRGALIRTGIGALIVGAGELVYQFTRLVERVGGVGEAFRLLSDLASEVWGRVGLALDAALARMAAGWEGLKATALTALDGAITGVVSFGDRSVAVFTGAFDAMKAIWGRLPAAIGDFAFQAANGLIGGVEAMLNGVVTRINGFISALNGALDLLPEMGDRRRRRADRHARSGRARPGRQPVRWRGRSGRRCGGGRVFRCAGAKLCRCAGPWSWCGGRGCPRPGRRLPRGGRHAERCRDPAAGRLGCVEGRRRRQRRGIASGAE